MTLPRLHDLASLSIHLIWTRMRLVGPGGTRSVVAEMLLRHQLLILNRSRQRAPNLRPSDRIIASLLAAAIRPARLARAAIVLKPSTIMRLHRALVSRKYHVLFTPTRRGKPGPKGPSPELLAAIREMKRRSPTFGYQRIAQQLSLVLDMVIDKDVVRRVLAAHYRPDPRHRGSSWLTFLGRAKDSLWSVDFFRCESLALRTHWVMLVMDQFTRRIVGFAFHPTVLNGVAVCRMFARILACGRVVPTSLSSDHDPLLNFIAGRRIFACSAFRSVRGATGGAAMEDHPLEVWGANW